MKEHSLAIYETTAENGGMLRMTAGNCAQLKSKTHSENMRKQFLHWNFSWSQIFVILITQCWLSAFPEVPHWKFSSGDMIAYIENLTLLIIPLLFFCRYFRKYLQGLPQGFLE